jgi:carbon-monoxide dehydrogenase medium subunit
LSLAFSPKSYLRPKTKEELSDQLKKLGDRAKIIAGGTGIYEIAHRGLLQNVETLLDISGLNLSYVSVDGNSLKIGAATTMSVIANSKELVSRKEFAAISDALDAIQPLQVKNVATIGGAICTALPFFDLPTALLSLKARVRIDPGSILQGIEEFVLGYFAIALKEGEFVSEIQLPFSNGSASRASAFQKFSLTRDDWALINCGVSLSVNGKHEISEPVVAFGGGVGERPKRATATEKALSRIDANDENAIREVIFDCVPKELETVSDIRSSREYRLRLAKILGFRSTILACKRAMKNSGVS